MVILGETKRGGGERSERLLEKNETLRAVGKNIQRTRRQKAMMEKMLNETREAVTGFSL